VKQHIYDTNIHIEMNITNCVKNKKHNVVIKRHRYVKQHIFDTNIHIEMNIMCKHTHILMFVMKTTHQTRYISKYNEMLDIFQTRKLFKHNKMLDIF
jgi:hypothetical protein